MDKKLINMRIPLWEKRAFGFSIPANQYNIMHFVKATRGVLRWVDEWKGTHDGNRNPRGTSHFLKPFFVDRWSMWVLRYLWPQHSHDMWAPRCQNLEEEAPNQWPITQLRWLWTAYQHHQRFYKHEHVLSITCCSFVSRSKSVGSHQLGLFTMVYAVHVCCMLRVIPYHTLDTAIYWANVFLQE